jgi:acyl dehydratase
MYDRLEVGTGFGRRVTLTETHLVLANTLFTDSVPLHTDDLAGKAFEAYGGRIMPGPVVAGLAAVTLGMNLEGAAIAYLEQVERFKGPVFPGDTIAVSWRVAEKIDKPRFKGGIVVFEGDCRNQRDEVVLECEGKAIVTNDDPV